jgi:GcrA cell cycle regulator
MRLGERGAMGPPWAPSGTEFARLGLPSPPVAGCARLFALTAAQIRPSLWRGRAMTAETWTAERIEQLRNCLTTGLTCSQIAAEIGVSRNAVIGKIHRLGLSPMRPAGAPARSCPPRARHPRLSPPRRLLRLIGAEAPSVAAEAAAEAAPIESAQRCSLLDIAQGKCHWPIGDPQAADFAFCGNEAITGFSYCVGHARMAYRLPARRRA